MFTKVIAILPVAGGPGNPALPELLVPANELILIEAFVSWASYIFINSTRLLAAFPSFVLLSAMGSASPFPSVLMRATSI